MKNKDEKMRYLRSGLFFFSLATVLSLFFLDPIPNLKSISILFMGGFVGIGVMHLLRFKEIWNTQKQTNYEDQKLN